MTTRVAGPSASASASTCVVVQRQSPRAALARAGGTGLSCSTPQSPGHHGPHDEGPACRQQLGQTHPLPMLP
jgi:hypothetical protein